MDIENKNYYEILEIPFTCTQEEINQAYKRAVNAYDTQNAALYSLLTEEDCKRIIDAIEEAFSILGNPDKRMQYDKARGFDNQRATEDKIHKKNLLEKMAGANSSRDAEMAHEKNLQEAQKAHARKDDFTYNTTTNAKASVSRAEAYSKFSLDYNKDEGFETEIENATEFTGTFLQKIREYKNVSIERMADMTKVSKTHIRNIEEENLSRLPAAAYIRGFVFQYAKCLKLNPDEVCKSYLEHIARLREQEQGQNG